jgi:alpha-beta hydrolase superfamily lysophospholipase
LCTAIAIATASAAHGTSAMANAVVSTDDLTRTQYDVPTVAGETVRVSETTSPEALARVPRRVVVLIPGTIGVSRHLYEPPFDGYDAPAMLARAGFVALTMDLPGFGASTGPAH